MIMPVSVFALSAPKVTNAPGTVDANTFTLKITTEKGAVVSVLGGPADIQPVTDGAGADALDGKVNVTVGLAQNQENVFSITASSGGVTGGSVTITIKEQTGAVPQNNKSPAGDITAPAAPILEPYPATIDADTYIIVGSAEADANIYAKRPDGASAGSARANSQGVFNVEVTLLRGKTNRINISAEDIAGNIGESVQAVIKVPGTPAAEDSGTLAPAETMDFKDVTGHWAEPFITGLWQKGIVSGKTATSFDPNGLITRAELSKIALNTFGFTPEETVSANPFPDVPKDAWFARFVKKAKDESITGGFPDGTFRPNDFVNRAGAIKILVLASGLDYHGSACNFTDVRSSDWFCEYVGFAAKSGVVGGYADNTFRGQNNITRAEVAKIAVKLMELKNK
jgi:hypothetical protein